jgi:hypothetical protein
MDYQKTDFLEVTWDEARASVKKVNPEIAEIIDRLSPSKSLTLLKLKYDFGKLIVNEGIFQIEEKNLPQKLKEKISYRAIPLCLLLNKSSEVFIKNNIIVTPLNILLPGNLFGLFELLDYMFDIDSLPIWNVSAGARSVFMLPKLSDTSGLKRLKMEYNIKNVEDSFANFSDHCLAFSQISQHPTFNSINWNTEILVFTKDWFEKKHLNDPAWQEFTRYLYMQGWKQAQYAIQKIKLSVLWQESSHKFAKKNIKPVTYISDTLKHLFSIMLGFSPAFRPIVDSDLLMPAKKIQEAIMNVYELKNYHPTIMAPYFLNKENSSVYYSLSHPTLTEGCKEKQTSSTIMTQLKNLKLLVETCMESLAEDHDWLSDSRFDYFHVEDDFHKEIKSSKLIPEHDPSFIENHGKQFCYNSAFWRGCINLNLLNPLKK